MFSLIFNGCFNNLVEMARLSFQALRHPMAGRFFFFIPGFGAQNHRQDDLVVSFLFVVATENAFCSGRDSGFLR